MNYPILVNIVLPTQDKYGNFAEDITQCILDFDYRFIAGITKCYDGMAYLEFNNGRLPTKVMIPFYDVMKIYEEQNYIDDRYKEEVRDFSKDNYKYTRETRNRKNED